MNSVSEVDAAPPWFTAAWLRVVAVIVAGGLLLYLGVPSALTYLSIGSPCLGPACTLAERTALGLGGAAILLGLVSIVLLIIFAIRPRAWSILVAITCIALQVPMVLGQTWATRTLSDGRALSNEAMQLAFAIDDLTQNAVAQAVNLSVWNSPGVWGPDTFVDACPTSAEEFIAGTRLYFGPSSGVDGPARDAILAEVEDSTVRAILLPPSVQVSASWGSRGDDWELTVESECQPLPIGKE
jgi:hypothetical protein